MIRFIGALIVVLGLSVGVASADSDETFVHHVVRTNSAAAQICFDRGLTFIYAFNRQAAEREFRKAARYDGRLAVAWWGVALARGPNINIPMSKADMKVALDAIHTAKKLEAYASAEERALIDALATRYAVNGNPDKLSRPYAAAMAKVARAYPNDPDVEALYLESMLDQIWFNFSSARLDAFSDINGRATADVGRWPEHVGILHYFIHLTEPNPSALAVHVADTLASDHFAAQASHLTHMPSHVYVYVGEWRKVEDLNQRAVDMDITQAKDASIPPSRLDYFFHNLSFWYGASVMSGDEAGALAAAEAWHPFNPDAVWMASARFGHIEEAARAMSVAGTKKRLSQLSLGTLVAYALLSIESGQVPDAREVLTQIRKNKKLGNDGKLAEAIILGSIAEAGGDDTRAKSSYRRAIYLLDQTGFEEAPPWNFFPRELLAKMYLREHDDQNAAIVAKDELFRHPHNALALQMLQTAYEQGGQSEEAAKIKGELQVETQQR